MSPSWHAECRQARKLEKLTYAQLMVRFDRSFGSIYRALYPQKATHYRRKTLNPRGSNAEGMRKRWADPEWAARQRRRIAEGLAATDRTPGRPRKDEAPPARQPFDPLNSDRMKRILGGSR